MNVVDTQIRVGGLNNLRIIELPFFFLSENKTWVPLAARIY